MATIEVCVKSLQNKKCYGHGSSGHTHGAALSLASPHHTELELLQENGPVKQKPKVAAVAVCR